MTTEIFSENEYSQRIHVKFSQLINFRKKAIAASSGTSMSLGVEHLLSFLDEIRELKQEVSVTSESPKKSDTPEERMKNNFKYWGVDAIDSAIFKTIKYLRLRRNHIVHARTELTEEYERFLRNESHHLTTFWSGRTSLEGLDFSSKNITEFSAPEVYSCAKLLRVCMGEVDSAIASTFSESSLIVYMTQEILERDKKLKGSVKVLARKVRRCLIEQFGVDIDPVIAESEVGIILANA